MHLRINTISDASHVISSARLTAFPEIDTMGTVIIMYVPDNRDMQREETREEGCFMSKKTTDIIAYITPIGLIIALIFGDRENSKFHLNQALVLWLAGIIADIIKNILEGVPVLGALISIICAAAGIALFVFWIMGLVSAVQGTEKKVPVVGDIVLLK